MTNLSFALDSMTRDIRTGHHFYCDTAPVSGEPTVPNESLTRDCVNGDTLFSFVEGGTSLTGGLSSNRITYYVQDGTIYRKLGGAADPNADRMTSGDPSITELEFSVVGSEGALFDAVGSDAIQPTATIFVSGLAGDSGRPEEQAVFNMQTTVTQRRLDL